MISSSSRTLFFISRFLVVKRMMKRRFSNPVSTLDVLTKDIKLGLALGQSVNANMPLGELCPPFSPRDRNWASAPSTAQRSTRCSRRGRGGNPVLIKEGLLGCGYKQRAYTCELPFLRKVRHPYGESDPRRGSSLRLFVISSRWSRSEFLQPLNPRIKVRTFGANALQSQSASAISESICWFRVFIFRKLVVDPL